MSSQLQNLLIQRAQIIQAIRDFFVAKNFIEVDTPLILPYPSQEAYLEPLTTTVKDARGQTYPGFLIMSPEFSMKKLLARRSGNIFQLSHVFRNGEALAGTHQPEFSLLEWYEVGKTYEDLMSTIEELFDFLITDYGLPVSTRSIRGGRVIPLRGIHRRGTDYDLSRPFPRLTIFEALKKYADLDMFTLSSQNDWEQAACVRGYHDLKPLTRDDAFWWLMLNFVEPNLPQDRPVFLIDYPEFQAALAQRKASDQRVAERVELFVGNLELANGFTELTDPKEQRARFEVEQKIRTAQNRPAHPIDPEFITALQTMPPSAGCALGVDRLIMFLLGAKDISEVMPLPAKNLFR